jgi:RimJ/RimL family protein N-acetyltransferase
VKLNDEEALNADLTLTSDPAVGGQGPELQAEMLRLVVPWLSTERKRPVVRVMTDVDMQPVVSAAEELGMYPAAQLRNGAWRQGKLRDAVFYELLNPVWTSRMGDPGPGLAEAGAPVQHPTSPAPRRDPAEGLDLPDNAMIGSHRLALRPFQLEDAEPVSARVLEETDTSFGHSRFPYSAILLADWFEEMGKNDPASDFEVAVVHRETGELLGEVGLYAIDWQARTAESGWWLYRAEDRGKGYGTEANQLLLEYAFDHLGLNMIWAWVNRLNPRSQAGLRKQGYRDAGRFTWTGFGPDGFENALMFDILADEWRQARDG